MNRKAFNTFALFFRAVLFLIETFISIAEKRNWTLNMNDDSSEEAIKFEKIFHKRMDKLEVKLDKVFI